MKILRLAFLGLLAGFILSVLADRSVWLEMRVNTGCLLPLATIIAVIAGIFTNRQISAVPVLGLEIFLGFLLLWAYGCDIHALLIIPASSFKQGFFLHACDIRTLNNILAVLFILGNGIFFISPELWRHWRRKRPSSELRTDQPGSSL